jgi:acetoacetyl-CoA synthetase
MATADVPRKLWEHPDPRNTQMYILMQEINKTENLKLEVCVIRSK